MSIKCKGCLHESACKAWISHGELLYDDFSYSVEGCKEYAPDLHGRWIWKDGCFHCSRCKTSNDHTPAYCEGCGAHMDLEVKDV